MTLKGGELLLRSTKVEKVLTPNANELIDVKGAQKTFCCCINLSKPQTADVVIFLF